MKPLALLAETYNVEDTVILGVSTAPNHRHFLAIQQYDNN